MRSLGTKALLLIAMAVGTISFSNDLCAQQAVTELAKKFPGYVNAVMSVNAKKIRGSALAKEKGWTDSYEGKVSSGLIFVPDTADEVLMGSAMDFQTFHARTTAMLIEVPNKPDIELIRKATNGKIDTMLGMKVVETNDDHYVAVLDDDTVAAYRPAIRTDFLPWLSDLKKGNTMDVRPYLAEGLAYSDMGTEVIIAFDLKHVISREKIYDDIKGSKEIEDAGLDPKVVSGIIASIRGVTLGVTVTDHITGAVKIDFEEDVTSLKTLHGGIAKGVLERIGLHVDDFDNWEPKKTTPKQLQMLGRLSESSFRRLMAIVDAAPSNSMAMSSAGSSSAPASNDPATININYFDAVDNLVQEVKPKLNAGNAYTRNAKWLRKFAEKIDLLPVMNVDADVVDFGVYAASMLRDASQYMIDTNSETKTKIQGLIASGARSGGGVGYGGGYGRSYGANYGGYRWGNRYGRGSRSGRGTGQRLRDATRANDKTEAIRTLSQMFTDYDAQRADLRRELEQKYKEEPLK
ncbi:MAG: hypothetical protein GY819_08360 [Planctomycetaceae bacterium]|nr:hypothetical protein [Planctomycetaceae bacterium]MCP4462790.1 hypothetical protein [Planctomycetaceae bacterium]MDG1808990.1 hypothetical protein [Pirellulaceae bacterium]MDG2103921.1 hypothetical protein [Pirellulaceae bacterium]